MKYYSDVTRKIYDTPEALEQAELAVHEAENREKIRKERLANERKERAAQVEEARKELSAAQHKYKEALESFCKDYGTYHTSVSASEIPSLFDLFDILKF